MAVLQAEAASPGTDRRPRIQRRTLLLVAAIVIGTCLLRLPSFFEPPWHTDEGIFQAVAQRVAAGGQLYANAWESKPPLFLYIYVGLLELFGPGTLPLRIAARASAIGTELALFAVALRIMSRRQAAIAAGLLALLLGVPFWGGNLALTEIFAVLPCTLGVLCLYLREDVRGRTLPSLGWLALAGMLFGAAVLIRQTSAVVPLALVLWLLLRRRDWFVSGAVMGFGMTVVVAPVLLAFALFGSWHWFWNANVGFFLEYVPSGQEVPFHYRFVVLLPLVATIAALLIYRRRDGEVPREVPRWSLPALWLVLTLAAALLTGRPYPHYFLLAFPPLALLLSLMLPYARLSWRPSREMRPALGLAACLLLLWVSVVMPAFQGNALAMRNTKNAEYYVNFAGWTLGLKSKERYNAYFDKRIEVSETLTARLRLLGAENKKVYIWGEYPWVYSLTGSEPVTRYTTSFYVLLIPYLDMHLKATLNAENPDYIVVMADAWPKLQDDTGVLQRRYRNANRAVNSLIAERYEQVAVVGKARVFRLTQERPIVTVSASPTQSP